MGLRKVLCDISYAAALGATVAFLAAGCTTAKHRDWREAVKVGDYQHAYGDLYETWRSGTPDVKAEALRHAWRTPGIVAIARKDLVATIQPIADNHTGDLPALQKAIRKGPADDRVDFAKLVDRTIDLDREIALAYERRAQKPEARVAQQAAPIAMEKPPQSAPAPERSQPATTAQQARPEVKAQPAQKVEPAANPQAPAAAQPAVKAQPAEKVEAAATPPVAEKVPAGANARPTESAAPAATTKPAQVAPAPARTDNTVAESAALAKLLAQAAEAKQRAVWRCKGAAACDKAWAAAESFVGLNSDMRIRTAKSPTIETYPPIEIGKIGMTVAKSALGNDEAELRLTISCRVGVLRQLCPATELRVYTMFPAYMQGTIRP